MVVLFVFGEFIWLFCVSSMIAPGGIAPVPVVTLKDMGNIVINWPQRNTTKYIFLGYAAVLPHLPFTQPFYTPDFNGNEVGGYTGAGSISYLRILSTNLRRYVMDHLFLLDSKNLVFAKWFYFMI